MDVLSKIKAKLDTKGNLTCKDALVLAKDLNIELSMLVRIIRVENIKITACELGQFGNLACVVGEFSTYKKISRKCDNKGKITCKDALCLADENTLKVRSALKTYNIDVKQCQLGCFREKKGKNFTLRTKSWVEDREGAMLFGKGRTELLELIDQTGSISKAAKDFGMSYKKAWVYLHTLQKLLGKDLFIIKQGRGESAGTKLTPKTHELLYNFKLLQNDIDEYANKRFKELFLKDIKNEH